MVSPSPKNTVPVLVVPVTVEIRSLAEYAVVSAGLVIVAVEMRIIVMVLVSYSTKKGRMRFASYPLNVSATPNPLLDNHEPKV